MYSIINTPVKGLPKSLPYIDVALMLNAAMPQIPPDIVFFILHIYFRVIRPTVACANDHVVIGGYDAVTEFTLQMDSFEQTTLHADLIACGPEFTIISSGPYCYSRGINYFGQLGLGNTYQYNLFAAIPMRDLALDRCDKKSILQPMGIWNAIAISCGENHTFMISHIPTDASTEFLDTCCKSSQAHTHTPTRAWIVRTIAYAWGCNTYSQLGADGNRHLYSDSPTPIAITNPTAIACGDEYTLILADSLVYFCGRSRAGSSTSLCQVMVAAQIVAISACCDHYTLYTQDHQVLDSFESAQTMSADQKLSDKFAWIMSARAKTQLSAFPMCTTIEILSNADLTIMLGTPIDVVAATAEIVLITTTRGLYMFSVEYEPGTGASTTQSALLILF